MYYEKLKKKQSGENKSKLRTIYPKNYENFKNSKPRAQFTGSYKKGVHFQIKFMTS